MTRVYLSSSDKDQDLSIRIKDWLKFQDYDPIALDDTQDNREKLSQWHREIAQTLEACDLVILILTPEWVNSKWCFAEFTNAYSIGKTILAVIEKPLEDDFQEPGIPVFDLTVNREAGLAELASALRKSLPNTTDSFIFNPERPIYPGLRAYEEDDSGIFFARNDDVRRVIDRLNTRRRQGGARLISLLGAPGTGISSLMKAGVLPRLKQDQEAWIVLPVMRPTLKPIDEFSKSIAELLGNPDLWQEWANLFRGNDFKGVARELAQQLRERFEAPDAHILLPIDQGEELFSISDHDDAAQFLDILGAIFDDDMPYVGIVALRPDFLEDYQTADQLSHIIEEFSPRLMPLSAIREIILGPTRYVDIDVQDELVERILEDALEDGALPLVALALNHVYINTLQNDPLDMETYNDIGVDITGKTPLGNVIAKLAEGVLQDEQPDDQELETLGELFSQRLLWVDNDNRFVALPIEFAELKLKIRVIIRKFVEVGLLTLRDISGREMVEYNHLAILDHWPRLREWLSHTEDAVASVATDDIQTQDDTHSENMISNTNEHSYSSYRFEDDTGTEQQSYSSYDFAADPEPIPQEHSYSSYEFQEDSPDKQNFIDEAHTYVNAEILGPEDENEEDHQFKVAPNIFLDKENDESFVSQPERHEDDAPILENIPSDQSQIDLSYDHEPKFLKNKPTTEYEDTDPYSEDKNAGLRALEASSEGQRSRGGRAVLLFLCFIIMSLAGGAVFFWNDVNNLIANYGLIQGDATVSETTIADKADNLRKDDIDLRENEVSLSQEKTIEIGSKKLGLVLNKEWPILNLILAFENLTSDTSSEELRETSEAKLFSTIRKMQQPISLEGSSSDVELISFSSDNVYMATVSKNNVAHIWDLATGAKVSDLEGHKKTINSISFSKDNQYIVTGSDDASAKIWNPLTGDLIASLEGHTKSVKYALFDPNSERVATASSDNDVHLWDLSTQKTILTLQGHSDVVNGIAFSVNGDWIATASGDKTAIVWDAASGNQILSITGHNGPVTSVSFSQNSDMVMTSSGDKTVGIWHTFSGKQVFRFEQHKGAVSYASFSNDGAYVVSTEQSGKALLWDRKSGRVLKQFKNKGLRIKRAVFSPNGSWIASGATGNRIYLIPTQLNIKSKTFPAHKGEILNAEFDIDNELIVTALRNNVTSVWDLETGKQISELIGHLGEVYHSTFSPERTYIATGSEDQTIRIWDPQNGSQLKVMKGHTSAVRKVTFSSDESFVVSTSDDKTVRIWNIDSEKNIKTFSGHDASVTDVVYSKGGNLIYSASKDKTIKGWDVENGKNVFTIPAHRGGITALSLRPDGRFLASASEDGTVKFWDIQKQEEVFGELDHNATVNSLDFSADGKYLITGSDDKTVRMWHVSSGELLWETDDFSSSIASTQLSEQGNWALIASGKHLKLSRIFSSEELSFYIKSILPRCLSSRERRQVNLSSPSPSWCNDLSEWQTSRSQ